MNVSELKHLFLQHQLIAKNLGKGFEFPEGTFKAIVKGFLHQDAILGIRGKEILVRNEAGLIQGESIQLIAHKKANGFELQILSREIHSHSSETPPTRTNFPMEEIIYRGLNQSSPEEDKVYQLLKSYIPVIDWDEKTKYYHWNTEDGEGKAYYGTKGDEKRFFIDVQSNILGKMEILLLWKNENLEDLQIQFWFQNPEAYGIFAKNQEELKQMLAKESIVPINLSYHLKRTEIRSEWKA